MGCLPCPAEPPRARIRPPRPLPPERRLTNTLFLLARLTERDVELLLAEGAHVTCPVGATLARVDEPVDALSLILDGRFEVHAPDGQKIRSMYAGEMVGEVSFLDGRPASATVSAAEPSSVLRVPRARLQRRLDADPAFAARFYRALGTQLAFRVRDLTSGAGDRPSSADLLDADTLDGADLAGRRLALLLERARRE